MSERLSPMLDAEMEAYTEYRGIVIQRRVWQTGPQKDKPFYYARLADAGEDSYSFVYHESRSFVEDYVDTFLDEWAKEEAAYGIPTEAPDAGEAEPSPEGRDA